MQRRQFIKTSAMGSAAFSLLPAHRSSHRKPGAAEMFIGTPVLPEYLFEKGIPQTLEAMQELAGINTVMTFSHDHVFRQYQKNFGPKTDAEGRPLTNVYVKTNEKYYSDPRLQGRNPGTRFDGRDVLQELAEAARPRNMKIYARILEPYVITGAIPGFEQFAERDVAGKPGSNVCFNHPGYIRYWESVVEDLVRSHPDLHGFKFGQERGGPLLAALGKNQSGTCFCDHCLKLAKKRGLRVTEAQKGMVAIQEYGKKIREGEIPLDGFFAGFLRLLLRYPEALSWEQLWMDSREEQRKRMYRQIKGINEQIQVGWHIDHGMTWDIFMRASWDYSLMGDYSDWLSVAVYFDSMGRRSMGHFDRNYKDILFGDAPEPEAYRMYLWMLGYNPDLEAPVDQHRKQDTSFSSDYVFSECRRAVEAVNKKAQVYGRIGFDMPGYHCEVTPTQVFEATTKALEAGVDGLWCGREWDELKPENAMAFKNAVMDWRKKK